MNSTSKAALLLSLLVSSALVSCAPTVQLTTAEPLKVDISMKLEVTQKSTPTKTTIISEEEAKALRRRDERSGQIWALKNDGAATETANGYLEAHLLSGWDQTYVTKLVAEENHDRKLLYEREALESARPLSMIEAEAGQRLRQQAYGRKPSPVDATKTPAIEATPPASKP